MQHMKYPILAAAVLAAGVASAQLTMAGSSALNAAARGSSSGEKLTSALFLEDATIGGELKPFLPKLGAELAAALNRNGISVMRPSDQLPTSEAVTGQLERATVVQAARDLGATCYMRASATDFSKVEIADGIFEYTLSLGLNAYGAARGDGIYGDIITLSGRSTAEQAAKAGPAIANILLKGAAEKIAQSFAMGMRNTPLKSKPAKFKVLCDVPEATVVIDGAARGQIGEEGVYTVETGIHTIEVLDNPDWPYYQAFKTRAFIEDGARFTVKLYLNAKGVERLVKVNDYMLENRKSIDELLYWEGAKNDEAKRRSDEVVAAWMSYTNSLALSTFAKNSETENGNKITASTLRNAEKIVDANIEDKRIDRQQEWSRIENSHQEQMHETDAAIIQAEGENKKDIHQIDADVKIAETEAKAKVGVANAEAKGEVGKAEVHERIDAERHEYTKPVIAGVATQISNSWSRLEDTSRILHVSTRSEGDGIATVDYDPQLETTINLEEKNSRTNK